MSTEVTAGRSGGQARSRLVSTTIRNNQTMSKSQGKVTAETPKDGRTLGLCWGGLRVSSLGDKDQPGPGRHIFPSPGPDDRGGAPTDVLSRVARLLFAVACVKTACDRGLGPPSTMRLRACHAVPQELSWPPSSSQPLLALAKVSFAHSSKRQSIPCVSPTSVVLPMSIGRSAKQKKEHNNEPGRRPRHCDSAACPSILRSPLHGRQASPFFTEAEDDRH